MEKVSVSHVFLILSSKKNTNTVNMSLYFIRLQMIMSKCLKFNDGTTFDFIAVKSKKIENEFE